MRDPLGLNERFFAFFYPRLVQRAEDAGQRETRRALIAHARGRTLELGAGSGLNVEHYSEEVSELILTEPSPHMLAHLRRTLQDKPPRAKAYELVQSGAEELPFEDASVDTVVCTYVLCTVRDPDTALNEVARVLKPAGSFLFLEHVHAGEGTLLGRVQDMVALPHRYIAAGCHPNRRTGELIESSPLKIARLEHGHQPAAIPTVRPTILGEARKAA